MNVHCSFCGKPEEQVVYIVKGPAVYICNECIACCVEIITEFRNKAAAEQDEEGEL